MGEQKKPRRPPGYWDDEVNIESALRGWITKNGHFPTDKELLASKENGLRGAIVKHGGFNAWRAKLGFEPVQHSPGYWDDEANIESGIRAWMGKYGKYPSDKDLLASGDFSLRGAIVKHGGFNAWRRRFKQELHTHPPNYWSQQVVDTAVQQWRFRHGRFPTAHDLKESGDTDLLGAICKCGGFRSLRIRLREKMGRHPDGYWDVEANIEDALRQVMGALGRYPSAADLKKLGRGDLLRAIHRHGGLRRWKSRLCLDSASLHCEAVGDPAAIESAIRAWIGRYGSFPTFRQLVKAGEHRLCGSIGRTGGFGYWRKKLGYPVRNTRRASEMILDVERAIRGWMERHGKFPSDYALLKAGEISLRSAIAKTGGFSFWRERLGCQLDTRPAGYWQEERNIESEIRRWTNRYGRFPTVEDLRQSGDSSLALAISCTGGVDYWRAKLGYGPITPECLREHADVLARVILALDVRDTAAFWAALQKRWAMKDLTEAIREYVEQGKLERFRELLTAAG